MLVHLISDQAVGLEAKKTYPIAQGATCIEDANLKVGNTLISIILSFL